jgi:hypothetical protein
MADSKSSRRSGRLATGIYKPQPKRSIATQLVELIVLCVAYTALGAMAADWYARQDAATVAPRECEPAPSGDPVRAELRQTQMALAKEEAARAALQKIADASAEQVSRLETELRVLKSANSAQQ